MYLFLLLCGHIYSIFESIFLSQYRPGLKGQLPDIQPVQYSLVTTLLKMHQWLCIICCNIRCWRWTLDCKERRQLNNRGRRPNSKCLNMFGAKATRWQCIHEDAYIPARKSKVHRIHLGEVQTWVLFKVNSRRRTLRWCNLCNCCLGMMWRKVGSCQLRETRKTFLHNQRI